MFHILSNSIFGPILCSHVFMGCSYNKVGPTMLSHISMGGPMCNMAKGKCVVQEVHDRIIGDTGVIVLQPSGFLNTLCTVYTHYIWHLDVKIENTLCARNTLCSKYSNRTLEKMISPWLSSWLYQDAWCPSQRNHPIERLAATSITPLTSCKHCGQYIQNLTVTHHFLLVP